MMDETTNVRPLNPRELLCLVEVKASQQDRNERAHMARNEAGAVGDSCRKQ